MRVGRANFMPLSGGTFTGDVSIGAHKLRTTSLILKEGIPGMWYFRNAADDANTYIRAQGFQLYEYLAAQANNADLRACDVAGHQFLFKARGAATLEEVMRLQGHVTDPHVLMTLPMVLKPSAIPGTLVEGHFAYVADEGKLAFYDGVAPQFIASNVYGAFTTLLWVTKISVTNKTYYMTPEYLATPVEVEDFVVQRVCPVAGNIKCLRVIAEPAPGATETYVITVRINGVDSTLTCTLSDAETTGSDVAHTAAVALGDLLSVSFVGSDGSATGNILASFVIG